MLLIFYKVQSSLIIYNGCIYYSLQSEKSRRKSCGLPVARVYQLEMAALGVDKNRRQFHHFTLLQ